MARGFADYFSGMAASYAAHRPRYPAALFDWLAAAAPSTGLAWDAATGNGQAALGLAAHFARVVATDGSAEQLAQAPPHPRVEYRQGLAESSGLATGAVDLVTAAQAAHWFDVARWNDEVRRVLRPGGVVAIWCYGLLSVGAEVDPLLAELYAALAEDWPPERRLVEEGYRSLPFPFVEIAPAPFAMSAEWTPEALLDYLGTWSATRRHRARTGRDPLAGFAAALRRRWPASEPLRVSFPLALRAGRRGSGRSVV